MIGEGGSGPEEVGSTDGACMTTGANGAAFSVKAAVRSSGQNIAYDINRSPAILNIVRNGPQHHSLAIAVDDRNWREPADGRGGLTSSKIAAGY
jgi:hypothetical protein